MAGDWRVGNDRYAGFEGSGYAAALQDATTPMTARIKLDTSMTCTVSVRALKGGDHQDRALAVEVYAPSTSMPGRGVRRGGDQTGEGGRSGRGSLGRSLTAGGPDGRQIAGSGRRRHSLGASVHS